MKKKVLVLAALCALCMHGMEPENKWNLMLHGVNIHLIKGDLLDYYADKNKKTDIIICVGRNKQIELGTSYTKLCVGNCDGPLETIWWQPKKDSSYYNGFQFNNKDFPGRKGIVFLCIGEPYIFRGNEGLKYSPGNNTCYEGECAVKKSYEDLSMCYNTLLCKGSTQCKGIKNIAFPMLGADFGYKNSYVSKEDTAPIAIKSVINFLRKNIASYNTVELFVEEGSDFNLYKKLLMGLGDLISKIHFFLLAQQDSKSTLLVLPRDLIAFIAKLIEHHYWMQGFYEK